MAIDLSKVTSVVTRPVGDDGGPVAVRLSGSNTVEPQSGSGNATITFTAPVVAVQVFNASGALLTVTVAGDTHSVPDGVPYEVRRADAPFTTVTIAATGPWYAVGLR